jgi:Leucine-rich repeat (LRR) protein
VLPLFLHRWWQAICLLIFATTIGCGDTSHREYAQLINDLGGEIHVHVELGGTEITDSDLASLDFPDTVRSIALCDSAISDAGARELIRGSNLEQIDLTNTQITDAALEDLKQLPRLCIVNIASPGVSPGAFGKIRFFVSERMVTITQRSPIQPLPRLPVEETQTKPEKIRYDPIEETLPPAESLRGYDGDVASYDGESQIHLDFHDSEITDRDLADILLPGNIRSISLRGTAITDDGLRELIRARNLEIIDLRDTSITDEAVAILKSMPRLWKANIGSTNVSAPVQRELARMLSQKRGSIAYDRSRTVVRPSITP